MSPCGRSKEFSSSFGLLLDEDDAGRKPDNNVFITTLPMICNTSNLYNTVQIKVIEMILFLVLALSNFISSHTWL